MMLGTLTSCAAMNGSFGCNRTAGDHCTPVGKVNAAADAGDFSHSQSGDTQTETHYIDYTDASPPKAALPGEPVRQSETVQRIWIAPYQDTARNYHEPSEVFTVLRHSHWIGSQPRGDVA